MASAASTIVPAIIVSSPTSPTGVWEVDKLWEELVVGWWYAESAIPRSSQWRTISSSCPWELYLRLISFPQSDRPLCRTTSPLAGLDKVGMIRHVARVAVVAHTIATMASPRVPSLALVFVRAVWFT